MREAREVEMEGEKSVYKLMGMCLKGGTVLDVFFLSIYLPREAA